MERIDVMMSKCHLSAETDRRDERRNAQMKVW